jgi:hypothetical protein
MTSWMTAAKGASSPMYSPARAANDTISSSTLCIGFGRTTTRADAPTAIAANR